MSPALLDTGAPARNLYIQNPNPSGQFSSPSFLFDFSAISSHTYKMSHTMNTTSKAPDKASSGFSNSNETNPDFSFDSQSIPRSGSASVSAGLTKPRIYKTKRSLGSNHPRSSSSSTVSETWVDPGFNQFRFDSANLNSISSGSEMREKNEAFAFGGSLRDSNANLNSGSSGNVENDVLDDMKGLSIGDEEGIMNAKGSGFKFDTSSRSNMNVKEGLDRKGFAFKGSSRKKISSFDGSGVYDGMRKLNIDDMKGLSIGDEEGIMNAKGSGFKFDTSSRTNMNVKDGLDRKGFAFKGSSRKKISSFDESAVYDGMRKLNIGDLDTGVFLEKNIGTEVNLSANDTTRFGFGSGDNVASSVGKSVEAELPNEFKKLNAKNNPVVDRSGRMFNPSDNNKFLFKSSDSSLGSSGTALPDQMKNLNLKDSGNVNGNENNNLDIKNSEFVFGSTASSDSLGVRTEKLLSDQLGHMKIESGSSSRLDGGFSSHGIFMGKTQTGNLGGKMFPNVGETITMASTFETVMPVKDASGRQVPSGRPYDEFQQNGSTSASSFSAAGDKFQFSGSTSEAPSMNIPEKTSEFLFTKEQEGTGAPHVVFKTPNAKGNLFSSSNQKLDVNARRGATKTNRSKKGIGQLSRQRAPVQVWLGPNPVSGKSSSQENQGSPASYSPMDVSPYQETLADNHRSRETSVTSDDSYHLDNNDESSDLLPTVSNDAMDEDLASAAQRMNINDGDENCEEKEECSEYHFDKGDGAQVHPEESISGVETESFKSATEELDFDSDTFTSSEASLSSNIERQESDGRVQFCFPSSEDTGGSNFVFAASSSAQGQAAARQYRKKNWLKAGADSSNSPASENVPYAAPHIHTVPFSGTSSLLSVGHNQSGDISLLGHDSEVNKKQEIKQVPSSTSVVAAVAAQEACEKWRLRGNQSYANGDLSKAEDYYTRGVNSVSRSETSRSCLRALMLCYSNRAAARISLRRMREALEDCMLAAALDPSFLRVQLRAASCYLALGEIEEASLYFKKCLQSGTDVVDRKILVEASEGLQKAQKVSECMKQSAELMRRRTSIDAESALGVIAEALIISPHSEKLLEMKAEALFMLRKYEEVIHLCEKSLDSAMINSPPLGGGGQAENSDTSVLSKSFSFKLWRFKLIFKSYFYLGKLEEALDLLEKQDGLRSGSSALDSTITLVVTVRELLRNKVAGNEAFQSGRHAEAIEHYTAALSCNVESRPFAAICFCNRAVAYKALGQITDAIADCSLAIALDKKYLKALSRRASLFEMIRDYGQASSDLQRLVSLLNKQVEEKTNQSGTSDRITSSANDLRQAQLRLSEVEEEARKEIPLNIYLILGIEPSVSASEIKKAYRKAALRHHPDKAVQSLARSDHGDDGLWKEIAEEVHKDADRLFKMIGEAYAILSNPSKRARYDLEEEIRTAQKKGNGSSASRSHADVQNYPFERSGSRRHWREVWKSYGHS